MMRGATTCDCSVWSLKITYMCSRVRARIRAFWGTDQLHAALLVCPHGSLYLQIVFN